MKLDELENTLLDQIEKLNDDSLADDPEKAQTVNIERIEGKYRTLFLKFGGVDGNPEVTKIRILQAKMRAAQLDLGEKIGTVRLYGKHGRYEIKRG